MHRTKILLGALAGAAAGAVLTIVRIQPTALDTDLLRHQKGFLVAAVACWAIFGVYWDYAGKNAKSAKSSESRSSRSVHVILANVALVLEIAPIRGLGRALPISPLIMAAGLLIEVLGLALAIWARRHLGGNWSGAITIKQEHELIRSGPYRMLRHPIYTGILAMYTGVAILMGEWLAFIGLAMAAFAYWRKIRLEETTLGRAFGERYAAYRRSTWALVPGLF
jgi:protein-S-isoprenylcysteine O-methyltransferase Ste14